MERVDPGPSEGGVSGLPQAERWTLEVWMRRSVQPCGVRVARAGLGLWLTGLPALG